MQRTGTILIHAAFEMACFSDLKDEVQVSSEKVIYHEQMCNNLLIDTQNPKWVEPTRGQCFLWCWACRVNGCWHLWSVRWNLSWGECGTRAKGSQSTAVGHAKGPADASKIPQHTVLLLSLLPLSFGLHPTPSLRFCVMGWQGMWLLPGCDPWEWQISPPASKLRVLTSADVSVVTTAFSPPLLFHDPHLKQVLTLLQTWVEKNVLGIAFSCGRGVLSLVLGFKRIPNVGTHTVFLF